MANEKKYRIWFDQINKMSLDVKAINAKEAEEKARRKWKREYAYPRVRDIKDITNSE